MHGIYAPRDEFRLRMGKIHGKIRFWENLP